MREVARARWTSIAACRDMGKSRLASYLTWWFLCTRPRSLVFTVAPIWDQLEESLWAEIRGLWLDSEVLPKLYPKWEVQTVAVKTTDPRWRALGVTSKDVANIEGRHADHVLVIIDESKGVPDEFFNSVQGMLSQPNSKLLAIGTPGPPRGWFARSFKEDRSLWNCHRVRGDDPLIPRLHDHFEAERQRLGEQNAWFRQQQCAEFYGEEERTIIPVTSIEQAVNRRIEPACGTCHPAEASLCRHPLHPKMVWPRVLSLDPASKGSDESVLTFRHGPKVLQQEAWVGWDEMRTAAHAAQRAIQFRTPRIVVDDVGVGAGIRSRIRQLLQPTSIEVFGFNGGTPARENERFLNRKTEQAFRLRDLFMRGLISIPDDPKLFEQLASWTSEVTASGKTKLVDPDRSPDRADSLLLAFASDSMGKSFRNVKGPV